MKSFEDCIDLIENELGVQLLPLQKEILYSIYNGHHPYVHGVRGGKMATLRAAQMLKEEMEEDNNNET